VNERKKEEGALKQRLFHRKLAGQREAKGVKKVVSRHAKLHFGDKLDWGGREKKRGERKRGHHRGRSGSLGPGNPSQEKLRKGG